MMVGREEELVFSLYCGFLILFSFLIFLGLLSLREHTYLIDNNLVMA